MSIQQQEPWLEEGLTDQDRELIRVYEAIGRPVDDLAYTPEFDQLMAKLGEEPTQERKHAIFGRLLNLRKRGRLPRLTHRI